MKTNEHTQKEILNAHEMRFGYGMLCKQKKNKKDGAKIRF